MGSKFEFTTAVLIGKLSEAKFTKEASLSRIFLFFFSHLRTCSFILCELSRIETAILEILVTINISLPNSESGTS